MNFNELELNSRILAAITRCGFTTPTPIQQQAIPHILAKRDILGLAQTGTGKTAAFILPVMNNLLNASESGTHIKVLVLTPTRELAEQINTFTELAACKTGLKSLAIYGGVSKAAQISKIRQGVDIIVACPGRLLDIVRDKAIDLSKIGTLILDEADHMFDQGFLFDIKKILQQLPREKQSLVFSATMPKEIRRFAEGLLQKPAVIEVNHTKPVASVSHKLCFVNQGDKLKVLLGLLGQEEEGTSLVFTRTKHMARKLAEKLVKLGLKATSMQGNLSQNKRQKALNGFKDGTFNILVATDIAARGIDVSGLRQVVNYDMPNNAETYIHRTGRTGRASQCGDAYSLATPEDRQAVLAIEKKLNKKLDVYSDDMTDTVQQPKRTENKLNPRRPKNNVWKKTARHSRKKRDSIGKGRNESIFGIS